MKKVSRGILDTGTSLLVLPNDVYSAIADMMLETFDDCFMDGSFVVCPSCNDEYDFDYIYIRLGDLMTVVDPFDYIYPERLDNGTVACLARLGGIDNQLGSGTMLLGDTFL